MVHGGSQMSESQHKWSTVVVKCQNQLAKYPNGTGAYKWSSTAVRCQHQLARMPKSTSCSQMVLNSRLTSEPIGKNAQIAISAHK